MKSVSRAVSLTSSLLLVNLGASAQQAPFAIHFAAQVNGMSFHCGHQTYERIGITKATIKPKDFRFYVSHGRLGDPECAPIFAHFGLAYGESKAGSQDFFRKGAATTNRAKAV